MEENNINIKSLIMYSKGGIISKEIFKTRKVSVTLFSMAEKTKIAEHTSIKQGFIYVIEGEGIFNLEGKKIKMIPGASINMKENAIHSLAAKKNTSFVLVLFGE